jgi:hypothetical protein
MNKLVVLTDLGTFRAFELEDDRLSSSPRLQPVESVEMRMEEGDDRIGRRLSDQAGRFTKKAPIYSAIGDQDNGERHNIRLESERRSVKKIVDRMSELLSGGQFDECYFAAASEINQTILDQLSAPARAKIQKNVQCNLVNAPREEILQHFHN